MIWYFLLSLHFIVEILGVMSHLIFIQAVVFQGIMDVYCRIHLGIISLSMLTMLVGFVAETLVCLTIGTVFEDDQCAQIPLKQLLLCVHRYAEMLSLASQLFFTIERVLSVKFSRIHKSVSYKLLFSMALFLENLFSIIYMFTNVFYPEQTGIFWLLTLQIIIFANFPFVYYAKRASKSKYTADVTTYSLRRKHNLYNYYEIARSFVFSTAIYLVAQLTVFTLLWLYVAELLFAENFHKLLFINSLIWNTNLTAFPWIVMLIHRGQRERIYKVWNHLFPNAKDPNEILGMDGKVMLTTPTQTDYFDQLKKAWE